MCIKSAARQAYLAHQLVNRHMIKPVPVEQYASSLDNARADRLLVCF